MRLGKNCGDNIDFSKHGFYLKKKHEYWGWEIWEKKSVREIGTYIQVWRNSANVGISVIKNDIKEYSIDHFTIDSQSQLTFLLKRNSKILHHVFKGIHTTSFKIPQLQIEEEKKYGSNVGSVSYSRVLPDGTDEKMIEWSGGVEIYRHPEYEIWQKEQDKKSAKILKDKKNALKEWLSTPQPVVEVIVDSADYY